MLPNLLATLASFFTQWLVTDDLDQSTTATRAALIFFSIVSSQISPALRRVSHQTIQPLACSASARRFALGRSSRE